MLNLAQLPIYYHQNNMHGYDLVRNDYMNLATFFMVVAVVTVLVLLVVKYSKSKPDDKTALDYAKERYAKGEINKTELNDIKKELKAK